MGLILALGTCSSAFAGFIGSYDFSQWTVQTPGGAKVFGDVSVDKLVITGADDGSSKANLASVGIKIVASGLLSFDWNYQNLDMSVGYDDFGYLLNGTATWLAQGNSQGETQLNVALGDVFSFVVLSKDSLFGPGIATIGNFSAPSSAVPEPASLALAGFGLTAAALGLRRRERRRG